MTSREEKALRQSLWHELLNRKLGRRALLTSATAGAAVLPLSLRSADAAGLEPAGGAPRAAAAAALPFTPIKPTSADDIVLPRGYRYNVVAHWGHDIGTGTPMGFNHDWNGFFPIDLLAKGSDPNAPHTGFLGRSLSSSDGLLVTNHEYVNPLFVSGFSGGAEKSAEQQVLEQDAVGMSVLRVKRNANGSWNFVIDPQYNRNITARTPMQLTGPAAGIDGGPEAIGTLGNCSGGMTPWGTALSCEENFQDYAAPAPTGYGWDAGVYGKRHYGWVVEVDPFDKGSTPRKHTAMGRFRHENVAVRVEADGTVVAYMGDDLADSCVYKFVADRKFVPGDRAANLGILESGKLYAADFSSGKWLLLDYDSQKLLQDAKDSKGGPAFSSQVDVLANARAAAIALRATPVDRPEDLEINPRDNSLFIALTNNTGHGNFHGQIVRLAESDSNPAATDFEWSVFATGGPQSGFSSPDNLVFDGAGNLWMVTDISSSRVNKGIYKFQGNNGLFYFRTTGADAGIAYQFASGPVECELTGLQWTPDGGTLFVSVQHPGEESKSVAELTSRWPNGGSDVPRPAVVAVTGFRRA
jgi:secreted PhoX family phosphatase